ncbi:MAG: outer membrane protein [Alphaproteobacteria bacterium]
MLRITMAGASALVLLASVGTAAAADIVTYEPTPTPVYSPAAAANWTGPYMGIMGGYGWGGTTVANQGILGGVYAGYNFQVSPSVVAGIEGDVSATGKTGTTTSTVTNPWNATLRGRVGYTMGRTMLYGTAGVAAGNVTSTGGITGTATQVGWTAGVGAETILTENLLGRVEVRHTNLGTTAGPISYSSTDVMAGLGLRF